MQKKKFFLEGESPTLNVIFDPFFLIKGMVYIKDSLQKKKSFFSVDYVKINEIHFVHA